MLYVTLTESRATEEYVEGSVRPVHVDASKRSSS